MFIVRTFFRAGMRPRAASLHHMNGYASLNFGGFDDGG